MLRTEALENMINSEIVSNALISVIPLVVAKSFEGKNIIEFDGSFYVIKEQYLAEIENHKKSLIFEYVIGKKEVPPEYKA